MLFFITVPALFMRITGLEPARRRHQILNLARLPIPPYPHVFPIRQKTETLKWISSIYNTLLCLMKTERAGIRTPDNLIKSQVLYHLSYTPILNYFFPAPPGKLG